VTLPLLHRILLPLRLARARRRGSFVHLDEVTAPRIVEGFDARFDEGEAAYNAIGRARDGRIVFAIGTKALDAGARLFAFDPASSQLDTIVDLDAALSSRGARTIPQGKVHVDLTPIGDVLYGATHVGYYDPRSSIERPGTARGYAPYPGGWFFALEHDETRALAQAPLGEGIITMTADAPRSMLFALTWPSGLLLSLDLTSRLLRNHGAVLGAGETGSKRSGTWTRICRSLGVDDAGNVYWSDAHGRIVRFDGNSIAPVATTPRAEMWRKVLWHPKERAFYGISWSSAALFRFDPATLVCDEIGSLRIAGTSTAATLAFALDRNEQTIHALATGPGILRNGAIQLASTVSHATFDLATRETRFSGPLRLGDGRWITQAQSLLLDGGFAYSLCWIEVPPSDPSSMMRSPRIDRANRVRELRRQTPEYRSRGYAEEMMLVRFTTGATPA
jgi:hypothetical protein